MDESKKKATATAMLEAMKELRAKGDYHLEMAERCDSSLLDMHRVWQMLDLGPYPTGEMPSISPPVTEVMDGDAGMTERIRVILKHQGWVLTPTQIRDRLVESGFVLEGRSNPMAEIHTVLKRLVQKPNSRFVAEESEGDTVYSYRRGTPANKREK
jgi:hypothetical protein